MQAYAFAIKTTSEGAPVRWLDPHVRFSVVSSGNAEKDRLLTAAAEKAARAWSGVGEVTLATAPAAAGTKVGWVRGAVDDNAIAWSNGKWTHDDDMLALTFLHYSADTGEILDADILVNDAGFEWVDATVDRRDDAYDLANAMTHEYGHALGLGHSDVFTATMFASSAAMETSKRVLDFDDEAGLREVYATVTDPTEVLSPELVTAYGCQAMPVEAPFLALLAVLAALALAPRRRPALARARARADDGARGAHLLLPGLLALAATAVAGAAQASPDTASLTLDAIVARAEAVAEVEVVSQTVEAEDGMIVTVSELRVLACRAGTCPRTLVLEQLGGEKDGIGMIAEGITPVKVGETLAIAAKSRGVRWRMVARDRGRLLDLRRPDPVARAALDRVLRVAR